MTPTPVSRALRARAFPLQGAHPAAWQSQFCCAAAVGTDAHMAPLHLQRPARRTTES
jgi:hypothetical protein